jgi:hypothetical protein
MGVRFQPAMRPHFCQKGRAKPKKKSRPEGRDSCLPACQIDQNVEVMSWLDR